MIKLNHPSTWFPRYLAKSVLEITPEQLKQAGITHIVFDLDRTLVARRTETLAPAYSTALAALQAAGFTILVGSNTRRDISAVSELLKITAIQPRGIIRKPHLSFYKRVISATGTDPKHIAMVGDHILNDVIGGNFAGLTTIMVEGVRSGKLPWHYRWYIRRALRLY
jgi:HAD superfamily phosphatase (TIGR01668 family)